MLRIEPEETAKKEIKIREEILSLRPKRKIKKPVPFVEKEKEEPKPEPTEILASLLDPVADEIVTAPVTAPPEPAPKPLQPILKT